MFFLAYYYISKSFFFIDYNEKRIEGISSKGDKERYKTLGCDQVGQPRPEKRQNLNDEVHKGHLHLSMKW